MARTPFQTVIKRARFDTPGFSPQSMVAIGNVAIKSIQDRMLRGQDIYDQSSPPLSKRYAEWKEKKYGSGVRDGRATGRTFRAMQVLQAGQNYAILGYTDPFVVQTRVRPNSLISRQWGLSDKNKRDVLEAAFGSVLERPLVSVQEK